MKVRVVERMYYSGMVLLLLLSVLGELIWLPDPIRLGASYFWIDMLDSAIYAIALIPLMWAVAAAGSWLAAERGMTLKAGNKRWIRIRSACIGIFGILAAYFIVIEPKNLQLSLGSLGITWLFVFVDLFANERKRRKFPVRNFSVSLMTIILGVLFFWPTSYLVTYPGLTLNMNRYAQASGGTVHGELTGVLIFERPAFPVDWLYAKLFPHYSFELDNLGMSLGDYNQLVRTMKEDANAAGSAVAFQKVGLGKGITSHGVLITAIANNSPAAGILKLGDVLEAVNGQQITMVSELSKQMQLIKPGDQVSVTVRREGKPIRLTTGTQANPDDPNRAAFGIQVSNDLQYDIPGIINYHTNLLHEGGPSHGAMLALTLIDQLTPGGVGNGNHVAGTGTIEPDASVGAVGGVEQKAYTVSRTDADVFFVPVENEAEARRGAPNLTIVPVHSLDDIIHWLQIHPKQVK
ncbi:PDZ domain-containing protein [Paenibacillus sp. N3.4]|uniref:PDZ domain-containing protein n=1 Tax=Paenibacillus sp. N3.4 TaxID=2603222 RepID=UPI0011CC41C6|nr:PDZ domain-containing protein [Paenibacillus sp. N3.4]TXK68939.1 PDZ domain-containing protein [Paenibacillus sp. N3.4]